MNKHRSFLLVLALVMIFTCAVSGVLAWLSASTTEVTNTFAPSSIGLALDEAEYDASTNSLKTNRVMSNSGYKLIPGWTLPKDPTVTVSAGSIDCYVFVEITETNNPKNYLDYAVASGWTQGKGTTGANADGVPTNVYYRTVTSSTSAQPFQILADNQVTVLGSLTQTELEAIGNNKPTIQFKAYAVQMYEGYDDAFQPGEAWSHRTGA